MTNDEVSQHSGMSLIMASHSAQCPMCRCAREHPSTDFGRFMTWHGTWRSLRKAHERVHGTEPR